MVGVLTYNIHSGVGTNGAYDLERVAGVIRRSKAEIACLQEVEVNKQLRRARRWSAMHADDQPQVIAKACGLKNCAFAATLKASFQEARCWSGEVLVGSQEASYGLATLTRFPILDTRQMMFQRSGPCLEVNHPSTQKGQQTVLEDGDTLHMDRQVQPRGALAVLLDLTSEDARPMWVINTHFSHRMASKEQRRQAREVLQWIEHLRSESADGLDDALERPTFLLAGDFNSSFYMPYSSYSVVAADERWRDLWKEAEAPCCCQASFPSYGCGGLFGMRIDHLFGLRVEGETLPMCEVAQVLRRSPADEMASDHCAVFAEMDFVEDPESKVKEEELLLIQ
ncbi:unnamed protein product [Cladocopium goreaui]|uniref:Endonuclease/exonuclease/phosphatase domain-containing protein n=1 Tax=Cladocopium goreaui TaxID=2562237 RepID=A0A9P1DX68_9DINO|nr:unnamed protein product [Cladocopium goreaui]